MNLTQFFSRSFPTINSPFPVLHFLPFFCYHQDLKKPIYPTPSTHYQIPAFREVPWTKTPSSASPNTPTISPIHPFRRANMDSLVSRQIRLGCTSDTAKTAVKSHTARHLTPTVQWAASTIIPPRWALLFAAATALPGAHASEGSRNSSWTRPPG